MKVGEGLEKLSLRPIVSNIGTATCETAKYLAKFLSPLGQSNYSIVNTADFIKRLRKEKIPRNYKMISFDVKSLFTNRLCDLTGVETIKCIPLHGN